MEKETDRTVEEHRVMKRFFESLEYFKPKNRTQLWMLYTIIFMFCVLLYFMPFWITNTSFIRNNDDGFLQHYECIVQLKNIVGDLLRGKGFDFWADQIGLGADSIGALSTVIFDPFNYIAIIFPENAVSWGYTVEIIVQMYVAGLAFLYFGKVTKMTNTYAMLGALGYSFSSWVVLSALHHNSFMTVAVLFPFIMAGVEKVRKKETPFVLIISVALAAASYFYFAYMTGLMVLIYLMMTYIKEEKKNLKHFMAYWLQYIIYVIIAACLTAISVIPTVYALQNAVKDSAIDYQVLHSFSSYISLFMAPLGGNEVFGNYSAIGITPVLLIVFPIVLKRIKEKKATSAMITFLMFCIFLTIPFINSVFNGFSYPVGRWCYGLVFFAIWSMIQAMPEAKESLFQYKNMLMVIFGAMFVVSFVIGRLILGLFNEVIVITCFVNLATVCVTYYVMCKHNKSIHYNKMLLTVMILNIVLVGMVKFTPGVSNEIGNYSKQGEIYEKVNKSTQKAATEIKDKGFYRVDQVDYIASSEPSDGYSNNSYRPVHTPANETLIWNTRSIYTYLSTTSGKIFEFNRLLGNSGGYYRRICTYNNDNRCRMDFLESVKYFLGNNPNNNPSKGAESYSAYGYKSWKESKDGVDIRKNKYSIGMGSAYDTYIYENEWLELNYQDREQALMECLVLPDEVKTDLKHYNVDQISSDSREITYSSQLSNVELDGESFNQSGSIKILSADNNVTFHIDKNEELDKCELYIQFDGVEKLENSNEYEDKNIYSKLHRLSTNQNINNDGFSIDVKMGNISKKLLNTRGNVQGFSNIDNMIVNMGSHIDEDDSITITFDSQGEYKFRAIKLYAVPIESYEEFAVERQNNKLNLTYSDSDNFSGTIQTTSEDNMLFLSIPYTDGWEAYVDGEKTEIENIDVAFTGVEIDGIGVHTVEMRYKPIAFRLSVILFFIGTFSCLLIFAYYLVKTNYLWKWIEQIMYNILRICFKIVGKELSDETFKGFMEFIKFGIVGFTNTVISYVIYALCLSIFRKYFHIQSYDYYIAQGIAFVLSVLWSFYWNNKMVFSLEQGEHRVWWKALLKTYISYSFTGLFLNSILLFLWVDMLHVSEFIAPIINLVVSVPLNFIINKFWAFKKTK